MRFPMKKKKTLLGKGENAFKLGLKLCDSLMKGKNVIRKEEKTGFMFCSNNVFKNLLPHRYVKTWDFLVED